MNYTHKKLSNGLNVVVVPIPSLESVTTLIMVGAGSRYENRDNSGISHFLEHMAFKGTKKHPTAIEIASLIDGAGAESNAFTGKEYTGYYVRSAAHRIGLSFDILSDMLSDLLLDSAEIDKERGVIMEEINLYEDTPTRKINDVYEKLLYGDVPMGWDIAGRKEVIKSVTREDFVNYMKSFYSASNMVLVIAGKAEPEATLSLAEDYFGKIKNFKTDTYKALVEEQKEPQVAVQFKKTDQAHFALGVRTVGIPEEKKRYSLNLLSTILGGGMSSRLFHEVREKRGLAYYVRTNAESYLDAGHMTTYVGADPARLTQAIEVVRDEYKKVLKKGEITQEELTKAKEYTKGHFVLDLEDTHSVSVFYASDLLLEKKLKNPAEVIKRVDEVTLSDVQEAASEFLSRPLNLAIIGNFHDEEIFKKLLI